MKRMKWFGIPVLAVMALVVGFFGYQQVQAAANPPCTVGNTCRVQVMAVLAPDPIQPGINDGDEIWTWHVVFMSKRFDVPDITNVSVTRESGQGLTSFSNEVDTEIKAEADLHNYQIRKFYRQAFEDRCGIAVTCN